MCKIIKVIKNCYWNLKLNVPSALLYKFEMLAEHGNGM